MPAAGPRRWREAVAAASGWRRHGVAAGLGAAAAFALPPLHLLIVLVPSFVGLVWLIDSAGRPRRAFAAGWWFGFGYFTAGLYWIAFALLTFPERFGWMVPFAVFGLAGGLALFPGAAALLTHRTCAALSGNRPGNAGSGRVLILAAWWVAMEWLRGWALTGFPWNLMGTVWTVSDGVIQGAAVSGVYGLSLLAVTVAAMPAVLADEGSSTVRRTAPVVAVLAVLVAVWGGGVARLAGAGDETVPGVRLRLVQPNIEQRLKWKPELRWQHISRQLRMSVATAPGEQPPSHVIWAETSVPYFLTDDPELLAVIGAAAPDGLMIVGAPRSTPPGEEPFRIWNSIVAVDPQGAVAGVYDKFHLVPFGEYVPFPRLLRFAKITAGSTGYTPGPGLRTLRWPGLPPVSPLICYEVIFPGRVADPGDRPQWLLNLTNDAWYGRTPGPYQHFAAARLRAVEEGLPLVRVANTGISAVVDAYGRTRGRLELGREGVLDSDLPVALEGTTPYGRLGDWVVLAVLLATLGGGIWLSYARENYLREN